MNAKEFKELRPGDVVRNLGTRNIYQVLEARTKEVILVKVVIAENPSEWEIIKKGNWILGHDPI